MSHYANFATLYTNPSGRTTRSVDWYTFSCVKEWFESKGKDYRAEIRGYRTNKKAKLPSKPVLAMTGSIKIFSVVTVTAKPGKLLKKHMTSSYSRHL